MTHIYVYTVPAAWIDAPREAYYVTYDCAPVSHAYDISKPPSHCTLLIL